MPGVTTKRPAVPKGLLGRIRRFILERGLIHNDDRVLVGVSGGSDSSCLLIVLASLRRSLKFQLCAAHIDHQLRGKRASAREAKLVRSLAEQFGVPLEIGAADVRSYAKAKKLSIEEAARHLRYTLLAETATEHKCDVVAVGHTSDDQAETVLLHLIRGSGLRGLAAMSPSAPWPFPNDGHLRLIRPLLQVDHASTLSACAAVGINPVDDPSNRSDAHTRSRIRHDVLPVLRDLNPQIDSALARLADATALDLDFLEMTGRRLLDTDHRNEVRIDRKSLASSAPAIQRHAVRLAVDQILGDTRNLTDTNVRSILSISAGQTGASAHLTRGLRVTAGRRYLSFSARQKNAPRVPVRAVSLSVPGQTIIGGWKFLTRNLKTRPRNVRSKNPYSVVLDADTSGKDLQARRRRSGDRLQPLGMPSTKKLQDFLVDAHVPREERDHVPLVVSEHGIVWVVGQRPAEWAKVTTATKNFLRIIATS